MVIVEFYLKNIFDVLYHHLIIELYVELLNDIVEYQLMFVLKQIKVLIMDQYHYLLEFLI